MKTLLYWCPRHLYDAKECLVLTSPSKVYGVLHDYIKSLLDRMPFKDLYAFVHVLCVQG